MPRTSSERKFSNRSHQLHQSLSRIAFRLAFYGSSLFGVGKAGRMGVIV